MFQVFLFLNISETQGLTMNLSDLLHVDLYNENLKMIIFRLRKKHYQPLVMIWMNMSWRTCMSDNYRNHPQSRIGVRVTFRFFSGFHLFLSFSISAFFSFSHFSFFRILNIFLIFSFSCFSFLFSVLPFCICF